MSIPGASVQAEVRALAARVQRWEDERAVLAVLTAYGHAIDAGDEVAWLACFTDDARFSTSGAGRGRMAFDVQGRAALADFVARHSRRPHGFQEHLVLNPVVTVGSGSSEAGTTDEAGHGAIVASGVVSGKRLEPSFSISEA